MAEFVENDAGIDEKMLSGLAARFDPRHVDRLQRVATRQARWQVPVMRASALLERHGLFHVDYCSIDTEGAELAILGDLDFDRFRIDVFSIESALRDERIMKLMAAKGYTIAGVLKQDILFRHREVKTLPQTTVI